MAVSAMRPVRTTRVQLKALQRKAVDSWKWISVRSIGFAILGCAMLSVAALYVATTDKIIVGPFSVPKEYEERGYTSDALSNAVVQYIHGNESTVTFIQPPHVLPTDGPGSELSAGDDDELENISASVDGKHVVSSFDQSNIPDIKVPLTSLSLEALIDVLRATVGRPPTRIAGEIVALNEADSSATAQSDPQRTRLLIRYKIEYPELSHPVFGYHWWWHGSTTITDTLRANGAEEVVRKLALVTADALGRRTLRHESNASRARRLIGRGNTYFGLGSNDYGRAEGMYNLANNLKPSGHAYLCMGAIEEHLENYKNAETYYKKATKLPHDSHDDDSAWALLYWGNLLLRQHQPERAMSKYVYITKRDPNPHTRLVKAAAQNNLGFVYLSKHDWNRAELSFREAERIAQALHDSAGRCAYSDDESSSCEDAKDELERANNKAEAFLSIDSTNQLLALAHYGIAQTLWKRGDDLCAIRQEYLASIQASANYPRAHYQLAQVYISQKSYKKAQDELQTTIQLDPRFEQAYVEWKGLIDRWETLPDKRKSDKPLNRTLARDYRNWGDTFTQAGNPDEAIDRYCKAADLDPTYNALCRGEQSQKLINQP